MRTLEASPVDGFLQQAAAHFRAGRLAEAENLYRQSLALRPQLADAHAGMAVTLFLQGRTDEAITSFHKALEIAPDDTGTLYKLAIYFCAKVTGRGGLPKALPVSSAMRA